MTDALRDAVRAACRASPRSSCQYPACHCQGIPHITQAAIAALAPHTEAEIARRVAEAVSAERARAEGILDAEIARTKHRRAIFDRMDNGDAVRGLDGDIGLLSALLTAIRNRSEPQ